jgi:hypothetical protein
MSARRSDERKTPIVGRTNYSKSTRFDSSKYNNRANFGDSPLLQKKGNGNHLHEQAR